MIEHALQASIKTRLFVALTFVLLLVGGVGGWAFFAKVAGAVVATGSVVVTSNTGLIEIMYSGIIKSIHVRDGDLVNSGQILITLDDTETNASLAMTNMKLEETYAQEARLVGELENKTSLAFSTIEDDNNGEKRNTKSELELGQIRLFKTRNKLIEGRREQILEQIFQLEEKIRSLESQRNIKSQEISIVEEVLSGYEHLQELQHYPKSEFLNRQREKLRLQEEYARFLSRIAEVRTAISEKKLYLLQIAEETRAEILADLLEVRSTISNLEAQRIVMKDRLDRTIIRAPIDGVVHNMTTLTIGSVLSESEIAMTIIPQSDTPVIEASVLGVDIDNIAEGQKASVRFPNFDAQTTPELTAKVIHLPPAPVYDPNEMISFYSVKLSFPNDELGKLGDKTLLPGMPAEVFFKSSYRTVISYILKPVADQIKRSLREI